MKSEGAAPKSGFVSVIDYGPAEENSAMVHDFITDLCTAWSHPLVNGFIIVRLCSFACDEWQVACPAAGRHGAAVRRVAPQTPANSAHTVIALEDNPCLSTVRFTSNCHILST